MGCLSSSVLVAAGVSSELDREEADEVDEEEEEDWESSSVLSTVGRSSTRIGDDSSEEGSATSTNDGVSTFLISSGFLLSSRVC